METMNAIQLPAPERGWSGKGSPCDAIHSVVRHHHTYYENLLTDDGPNLFLRKKQCERERDQHGIVKKIGNEDLVWTSVCAWERIREKADFFRWAVVSRKLNSAEELARLACLDPEVVIAEQDAVEKWAKNIANSQEETALSISFDLDLLPLTPKPELLPGTTYYRWEVESVDDGPERSTLPSHLVNTSYMHSTLAIHLNVYIYMFL